MTIDVQVHVPNLRGCQESEDRGGVTTVSNSLILGGWVTNVGVEGWVKTIF